MMYSFEQIKQFAKAQYEWAVETRRQLHRIPEPGFREEKTKALIKAKLDEIGLEYEAPDGGWITAYISGNHPGRITALRADFDALPIEEPETCPFRSEHRGYMHACGHDMHTAIMLATGRLLKSLPDGFSGGCLLMFEPAEENEGGAKPMAESGMLERYHVDRVYGLHVMPRLVVGQVESRYGALNASTDSLRFTVKGVGSHGAYPENGKDAIVCAGYLVNALQSIVSRNVSPLDSAVITIGTVKGGSASNIICDEVTMTGTLRCADKQLRSLLKSRIRECCEGVGKAFGCEITEEISEGYCALINSDEHVKRILDCASQICDKDNLLLKDAPSMGAEDFSYFIDRVPGAFFHIGCSSSKEHIGAPLHSRDFCPDERAMEYGIAMETALTVTE